MARIQGSVTQAQVQTTLNMLEAATKVGKGGQVAIERAGYMQDILNAWK